MPGFNDDWELIGQLTSPNHYSGKDLFDQLTGRLPIWEPWFNRLADTREMAGENGLLTVAQFLGLPTKPHFYEGNLVGAVITIPASDETQVTRTYHFDDTGRIVAVDTGVSEFELAIIETSGRDDVVTKTRNFELGREGELRTFHETGTTVGGQKLTLETKTYDQWAAEERAIRGDEN